jgi:hypothetical protein
MIMTRAQFARALGADEKWVENAARQLGRRFSGTPAEARRMALVRLLSRDLALPLARADRCAGVLLRHAADERAARVAEPDGVVGVEVDLARFHSTFAADLATALRQVQPRRRGRPASRPSPPSRDPLAAAAAHGVDLSLLRESLRRTPAERLESLDEDVAFLAAVRPRARARRGRAG